MLDVGCGNGATIRAFGQVAPGWKKAGTEFDDKYRADVESIPNTEPLHVGPVENVPGSFDVITMVHVLEHIVDPIAVLETLRGKLAPGGLLLIEVPHHPANPFELLIADHRTHFTSDSMTRALAAAGFEIVSVAEDWIPKELSVVARPAPGRVTPPPAVDAAAPPSGLSQRGVAWLAQPMRHVRLRRRSGPGPRWPGCRPRVLAFPGWPR
jgi:SAM-dependent methyltransferase